MKFPTFDSYNNNNSASVGFGRTSQLLQLLHVPLIEDFSKPAQRTNKTLNLLYYKGTKEM